MVLTRKNRASALVLGVALALSACSSGAEPEPDESGTQTPQTSDEPSGTDTSATETPAADKPVIEGFTTGDSGLTPPAGTRQLPGEDEQQWPNDEQLGLLVFDDHYAESEIFPTVELRFSPMHQSAEDAAESIGLIFPNGNLGEPVTIDGLNFERYVGSGELLVGTEYVETPAEVFFTRRNEGTYFLYAVGIPGESGISDEVRQTAFDALTLDTQTIDETFPPGQDDGSVTLELESFSEFTVGEDIEPGRYEVHAEIPDDVMAGSLIAHQDGNVYEAYREVSIIAEEAQNGRSWAGFIELYEGDTVSYTLGYDDAPPTLGTVTFKPLPEPSAFRTVLPGNGDWVAGIDFEPGTYQLRAISFITGTDVSIFGPDGTVIFDGTIRALDINDRSELRTMEPEDYISRELMIPETFGMPSVSNSFEIPAGSRILTRPHAGQGYSSALELIPATSATDRPEAAFVATAGTVNEEPTQSLIVAGREIEPGVYSVTPTKTDGMIFVERLGGSRIHSARLESGVASAPIYVPSGASLYISDLTEDPDAAQLQPAEPALFEGGELGGRMLRVGTDIEPGTWTLTGSTGMLDTFSEDAQLIDRVRVIRGHESTVELEEGQVIVDSDYFEFGRLSLDR